MLLLIRQVPWCCLNTCFHCFASYYTTSKTSKTSPGSENRSHLAAGSGSLNCSNDQQRPNLPESLKANTKTRKFIVQVLSLSLFLSVDYHRYFSFLKIHKPVIPVICMSFLSFVVSVLQFWGKRPPRSISMMLGTWPQCHQQWMTWQWLGKNISKRCKTQKKNRKIWTGWSWTFEQTQKKIVEWLEWLEWLKI